MSAIGHCGNCRARPSPADTVVDCPLENLASDVATGFVFDGFDPKDSLGALRRGFALWNRAKEWKQVQQRAMAQDFDWDSAAAQCVELYRRAVDASTG